MIRIVRLPDIGEGVAEAELVAWHVKVGDAVREDQILAEVMTDKATVEVPSPAAGTVAGLGGEVGSKLAVGGELVRLDVPGDGDGRSTRTPAPQPARAAADGPSAAPPAPHPPAAARSATEEGPLASPAVRQRAKEAGLDLRRIPGTGPGGRIRHADLDLVLRSGGAEASVRQRSLRTTVEEIPVTGLRRRIAERMAEATRRIAHFSYVEEVDVTALEELRAALNAGAAGPGRPRLTPLPFVMRALVGALADFPQMNAHYDDEAQVI
ncbi:MAG TPA: dihydrolipoamide acetyltransferase family protein, partial [Crenalkalicoccus sp.]|nr:dihydrolipoamide acetyltransferase family protein [Crenalkalicoccus sp.]